jgi:hypothetical protein
MKLQSLMTLSKYKLCLNDGILESGINSFQVTFSVLLAGHGSVAIDSSRKQSVTTRALWDLALSSIKTGLVFRGVCNSASWRKVHWSDESRFLLHKTDDRVCVWRQPNTAYAERIIVETVPFGGCSVMVLGCVSYNCKRQPQWTNLSAKHP